MQYYKPNAAQQWVGDCMPFYHDGLFHFYYLLDEGHHRLFGGRGLHQWAHASSPDLVNWTHHPLALPITDDSELSICTGSVFFHDGIYYAFHAVRRPDWTQRLGVATSTDGIHFTKHPVPDYAEPPPGYDPLHFRDPFVFFDPSTNAFHMLVTAKYLEHPLPALGGCLAHLVSDDLQEWQVKEPFFIPGFTDAPECSDYFEWNGWYYLLYSNRLQTRYRMSRNPFGPWQRPAFDLVDSPWMRVLKTAPYHDNRRIGVAWVGTRTNDSDTGAFQWGGHAVFRELVQLPDGTLGTKFPLEMIPPTSSPVTPQVTFCTAGSTVSANCIHLEAADGMAAVGLARLPRNARITLRGTPGAGTPRFGVRVRESAHFVNGVMLDMQAVSQRVELHDAFLDPVTGLDAPFTLDIILKEDLIDVCLNDCHCLINRCPEQHGDRLTLFCHTGSIDFENLTICPLIGEQYPPVPQFSI
jgi:beta-fructofuranosidase